MLNYIKKYVSPEQGTEVYEIGFQGGCYSFTSGDDLTTFLDYIEKKIRDEITVNEGQLSQVGIGSGHGGHRILLDSPVIAHYNRVIKKLNKEIDLINVLRRHQVAVHEGTPIENDMFSEENNTKGVGLKDRIKMELGFRPSSIKQLEVYRGIIERKIDGLREKKQGSEDRRSLAYPLYTMGDIPGNPLRGDDEEVSFVYETRLHELEDDVIEASQLVSEESDSLNKEWDRVDDTYRTVLDIMAYNGYSEALDQNPETTKKDLRYRLRKALVGRDYEEAHERYDHAYDTMVRADESLAEYRKNVELIKRGIVREILAYNKQLAYERSLDAQMAELREKGKVYVRKFK